MYRRTICTLRCPVCFMIARSDALAALVACPARPSSCESTVCRAHYSCHDTGSNAHGMSWTRSKKATHNGCWYVLRLPSLRLIQELVQAWRAMRRWSLRALSVGGRPHCARSTSTSRPFLGQMDFRNNSRAAERPLAKAQVGVKGRLEQSEYRCLVVTLSLVSRSPIVRVPPCRLFRAHHSLWLPEGRSQLHRR